MEKLTRFFACAMTFLAITVIVACSSTFDEQMTEENPSNVYRKVSFNVSRTGFDDEPTTRSAAQWENGDTVYLLFTSGEKLVYGDAVYDNGEWYVNYNGDLTRGQETNVHAVYFENKVSESNAIISVDEKTAIYEDKTGKYTITDGSLSITATLKPKSGRVRLQGESDEDLKIYGITHATDFNRYTGEYSYTKGIIKTKPQSSYTPYIYGEFTDSVEPRLNVWKASEGFTRIFPSNIYKPGESGYITIPTSSSHNGWQNNVIFKIKDVEFTMIPVEYSSGNFLLAQTETTEALYEAVMNDGKISQLPKSNISYSGFENFINALNSEMVLTFNFPSVSEWEFAAKGGNKSQGFTYSGSNDIAQVAWYDNNSGNTKHEVATKQPNELGFYDMSGNVWEWTEYYYNYPYNHYYYYGGSYQSSSSDCKNGSRGNTDSADNARGMRLYMSNK